MAERPEFVGLYPTIDICGLLQINIMDRISSHLTAEELQAGLDHIRRSPKDEGVLDLIVRRQAVNEREVLEQAELDLLQGLIGDTWNRRRSKSTPDG